MKNQLGKKALIVPNCFIREATLACCPWVLKSSEDDRREWILRRPD
jgi:hypothetical protein